MKTILLRIPGGSHRVLSADLYDFARDSTIAEFLGAEYSLHWDSFWLDRRGDGTVHVRLRLLGGKGGFGSNLRAQGSKMSSKRRAGTRESCRDLAGRRLRTLNQSRMINEYLARQPELERRKEKEIRVKMLKAIEAADRKPVFDDVDYLRAMRETVATVESAVYEALLGDTSEEESESDVKGKEKLFASSKASTSAPIVQ